MKKFGIVSVAPQAETIIPKPEIIIELKHRFNNNIFSLYDWDRAGVKGALRIKREYGIQPLFFTRKGLVKVQYDFVTKDFADSLKRFGVQDMIDIIEYTKSIVLNDIEDLEYIPF